MKFRPFSYQLSNFMKGICFVKDFRPNIHQLMRCQKKHISSVLPLSSLSMSEMVKLVFHCSDVGGPLWLERSSFRPHQTGYSVYELLLTPKYEPVSVGQILKCNRFYVFLECPVCSPHSSCKALSGNVGIPDTLVCFNLLLNQLCFINHTRQSHCFTEMLWNRSFTNGLSLLSLPERHWSFACRTMIKYVVQMFYIVNVSTWLPLPSVLSEVHISRLFKDPLASTFWSRFCPHYGLISYLLRTESEIFDFRVFDVLWY